jgi:hypothetical protein
MTIGRRIFSAPPRSSTAIPGLSQLPRIPLPSADRPGPPLMIHQGHRRRGTKHGVLGLHPLILPNHSTLTHVRSCRTVTIFRMKGLRPLDDDRREVKTAELPRRSPSRELDGLLGAGSHFLRDSPRQNPFSAGGSCEPDELGRCPEQWARGVGHRSGRCAGEIRAAIPKHALTVAVRELLEPGDDTGQIAYEINLH